MASIYEILGVSPNADEAQIRKAYRDLARRWHPDRFMEGPERMWAEQKMISINNAYRDAMHQFCAEHPLDEMTPEMQQLADARRLLELGRLSAARQALMRVATRNAEWNYLFGAVMLRLGEYEKAVLYFGIAVRQHPQNQQYRTAYMSASIIRNQRKTRPILSRLAHPFSGHKGHGHKEQ